MSQALKRMLLGLDAGGTLSLTSAVEAWHQAQREHGVRVLDDHEAELAPGLYVPVGGEKLGAARVRTLARSWELFDRAFSPRPSEEEREAFDTRVWPFLEKTGLLLAGDELITELLFLFDDGSVASFPPERWDEHLARAAGNAGWQRRRDWTPSDLAAYLRADEEYDALLAALRRITAAAAQ